MTESACRLSAVGRIAQLVAGWNQTRGMLTAAATALQQHFGWDHVGILIVDQGTNRFVLEALATDQESDLSIGSAWPLDRGVAADVVSRGIPRLIEHGEIVSDDVTGAVGLPCQLCLPVIHGDEAVAVLHVATDSSADDVSHHIEELQTIAEILAGAIFTARRMTLMEITTEVARLAVASDDLRQMLQRTVEFIVEQLRVTVASILRLNAEGTHFAYEVVVGELSLDSMDNMPVTEGVSGRCVRTGEPQLVIDPERDVDYRPGNDAVQAEYMVPIVYAGRTIGVLNLESRQRDVFTNEVQQVCRSIAMQIAGVIHLLDTKDVLQRKDVENTRLLQNILPDHAISELRWRGRVSPRYFREATVLFTDFTGFTLSSERLAAEEILDALNAYFSRFDAIAECYGMEKIKTIGDAYMCVAGIPHHDQSNVVDAILAATAVRDVTRSLSLEKALPWDVRIGIHSGPLISGVIGTHKLTYDVWGSTVNLASRIQEAGKPGEITISEQSRAQARDFFVIRDRGQIETREGLSIGIGEVIGPRPELLDGEYRGGFARRYELYYGKEFPGFPTPAAAGTSEPMSDDVKT